MLNSPAPISQAPSYVEIGFNMALEELRLAGAQVRMIEDVFSKAQAIFPVPDSGRFGGVQHMRVDLVVVAPPDDGVASVEADYMANSVRKVGDTDVVEMHIGPSPKDARDLILAMVKTGVTNRMQDLLWATNKEEHRVSQVSRSLAEAPRETPGVADLARADIERIAAAQVKRDRRAGRQT